MTAIKRRLEKLEASCHTDAMERAKVVVRNMSLEEINAELRACMLKRGFDPSLPLDEALAAYIAKREAELDTLSDTDREYSRQYLELVRKGGVSDLRKIFPECPSESMEVHHV